MPKNVAICGYIVGGCIFLYGVRGIVKSKKKGSRIARITQEMKRIGKGILLFLSDRERHDPSSIPHWYDPRWNSWNEERRHEEYMRYSQKLTEYARETMRLYQERFAGDVIYLVEEAMRLGYRDNELEQYYKRPTNMIGAGIVGNRLNALAEYIGNDDESSGK